jgi:hypothetical protein
MSDNDELKLYDFDTDIRVAVRTNVVALPIGQAANNKTGLYRNFTVRGVKYDDQLTRQLLYAVVVSIWMAFVGLGAAVPSVCMIVGWWYLDFGLQQSWVSVLYALLFRVIFYCLCTVTGRSMRYLRPVQVDSNVIAPIASSPNAGEQVDWSASWWKFTHTRRSMSVFVILCLILDFVYSFYIQGFVALVYIIFVNMNASYTKKLYLIACLLCILGSVVVIQYYYEAVAALVYSLSRETQFLVLIVLFPLIFLAQRTISLSWLHSTGSISHVGNLLITNAIVCFESLVLRCLVLSTSNGYSLARVLTQYACVAVVVVLTTYATGLLTPFVRRCTNRNTRVGVWLTPVQYKDEMFVFSSRLFACIVSEHACIIVLTCSTVCSELWLTEVSPNSTSDLLIQGLIQILLEVVIGVLLLVSHMQVYRLNILDAVTNNSYTLTMLIVTVVTFTVRLQFNNLLYSELQKQKLSVNTFLDLWALPPRNKGIEYSGRVGDSGVFFGLVRWVS